MSWALFSVSATLEFETFFPKLRTVQSLDSFSPFHISYINRGTRQVLSDQISIPALNQNRWDSGLCHPFKPMVEPASDREGAKGEIKKAYGNVQPSVQLRRLFRMHGLVPSGNQVYSQRGSFSGE